MIKRANERIIGLEKENSELCDDIDRLIYKLKQSRKDTATKVIDEIKSFVHEADLLAWIDAISMKFGVEVE